MNETQIIEVANADWHGRNLSVPRETLLAGVERGKVLYFPNLRFAIEGGEQALARSRTGRSEPQEHQS